jgi:aldehyde oxidoreductase
VAPRTRAAAPGAAALVEVSYDVLEPLTRPANGIAPRLHDHAPGNVLSVSEIKRSNVDAALASAAHVVSETFQTQFIEHAFLEPESSLAYSTDGGGMYFYSQDQDIWSVSRQVASLLGLSQDKVLATLVSSGGAFGAKEDLGVQRARRAARRPHGSAGQADPEPGGEPAFPGQAAPAHADLHSGLRR